MGWVFAVVLAALVLLGLQASGRCSRLALEIAAAALLAGLAGYGWQGSPDLAGRPVAAPSVARTNGG
ncbi:MAG TPA: hypothetical protein VI199_08610 [Novosphingobium sp.]